MAKNVRQSAVKERLHRVIDAMGISIRQFQLAIGVSSGYMTNMVEQPSRRVYSIIASTYPRINIDYIKTGEGEMFKESKSTNNINIIKDVRVRGNNNVTDNENCEINQQISDNEELIKSLRGTIEHMEKLMAQKDKMIDQLQFMITNLMSNGNN